MSAVPTSMVKAEPASDGMVQVVAPMELAGGYQLQVIVEGRSETVSVPPGGVKEGQTFLAKPATVHNIPSGHWRDGLCDCFDHGCCHAMCWCTVCFGTIVAGQVMTRMSRDFLGGPGRRPSVSSTCQIVTGIYIFFWILQTALQLIMNAQSCYGARNKWDETLQKYVLVCPTGEVVEASDTYRIAGLVLSIVSFVFFVYVVIAVCRTRKAIRDKYQISPKCCGECEDCCCSYWCSCCTVMQMARHTNDYKTYDVKCCSSACCSKRGQLDIVPEIV